MLIKKIFRKIKSLVKNANFKNGRLYIFQIDLGSIDKSFNKYKIHEARTISEIHAIIEDREKNFKSMYSKWLSEGFVCFVASENNVAIGVVWMCNNDEVPLEFGYRQKLENKRQAGLIDAYVLKNKRGKGAYKALWNSALNEISERGIDTLYGYILKQNILSFKVHAKLGMTKVVGQLFYFKILWFKFYSLINYSNAKDITELLKIKN